VSGGDAVRTGLRGLGQILITFGVVVLLFCVYELEVTGLYTAQQQDRLGRQLTRQWAQEPITPARPGQPARPVPVALSLGGARATTPERRCPGRSAMWCCPATGRPMVSRSTGSTS